MLGDRAGLYEAVAEALRPPRQKLLAEMAAHL